MNTEDIDKHIAKIMDMPKSVRWYFGVDNGLDGGVAMVRHTGQLWSNYIMPVTSNGSRRTLDAMKFKCLCNAARIDAIPQGADVVFVYERPTGSQNARAAVSMQDSFARIETTLMNLGVKRLPITPATWQKTFWKKPKMPKGKVFNTKAAALKVAMELWPEADWLKTPRCRVPHDGMVDAALIAEYARRANL